MTTCLFIIYLLFVHYVSDFVFQSSWMAINKSKSNIALGMHIVAYGFMLSVGMLIGLLFFEMSYVWLFLLANCCLHFITDYITSRISSHFYRKDERAYFWWTIGADQFIHQAVLISTAALILQRI